MTGPALIMMLEYAKELCTFTLFGIVGVFFPVRLRSKSREAEVTDSLC